MRTQRRQSPNSGPRALTFWGLNSPLLPAYVAKQGYRSPKRKFGLATLSGKNKDKAQKLNPKTQEFNTEVACHNMILKYFFPLCELSFHLLAGVLEA